MQLKNTNFKCPDIPKWGTGNDVLGKEDKKKKRF